MTDPTSDYVVAEKELDEAKAELAVYGKILCDLGHAMQKSPGALRLSNMPKRVSEEGSMDIDTPVVFDGSLWKDAAAVEAMIRRYSNALRSESSKWNALPKNMQDRLGRSRR